MQTVRILANRRASILRHLHPLRSQQDVLSEHGIRVINHFSWDSAEITDCDVLLVLEGDYRNILPPSARSRHGAVDFLGNFFAKFNKVIWFDTHDSSGMLRSYVMPFVDGYAKAQLLKNTSYYNEHHLTGVIFRDFVNETYGISDKALFKGPIGGDVEKLRMGWNLMLMDWLAPFSSGLRNWLRRVFPSKGNGHPSRGAALAQRPVAVSYRVGMHRHLPTVHWWRRQVFERLSTYQDNNRQPLRMQLEGHLPPLQYIEELQNTVVVPSPFGIGEICYRDFEGFMTGAVVLKPRMNHLETYPNLFVEDETYVAYEWDHSDFISKVDQVIKNPERYQAIADEGARRFDQALNDGLSFAEHFKSVIS